MSECVPQLIDEGNDQDQAVAICEDMWERGDKTVEITIDGENGDFEILLDDEDLE